MFMQSVVLALAAVSSVQATAVLVQRAPELASRDIAQGWSLQSGSAPTSSHSCGNGAYCPISLHCNSMVNNHQVAACCTSSNDCRGDVSGAPVCADSSWNLWVGYDGNGFCCETGLVGVYDITKSVAGTCVAPGNVGSLRNAVLTSTGTGAAATSAPSGTSSSSASATTTSAAGTTGTSVTSVVVSSSTVASASAGTSSTTSVGGSITSSSGPSTSATIVPTKSAGGVTNSTSTAAAGATSTPGAGVKTTAGFSLMGVAFVALAML